MRTRPTASLTGDTWHTSHRVFGQQSSFDELLNLTCLLCCLLVCCPGYALAVLAVASDFLLCFRFIPYFLLNEMFCLLCSVIGNVGQESSGDEPLNLDIACQASTATLGERLNT